jgi:predicted alpha/beta-fold hydrolase
LDNYRPGGLLRNGHFNTIYTAFSRKAPVVNYVRKRIATHDDDFLDLDFIQKGCKKIAILCHGLEGSSESKYNLGTSNILSNSGYDICAMNYRFCSGEINLKPQMYHSGWTVDLHTVIESVKDEYDEIYLAGFSLGGNLVLKYCGEDVFKKSEKIKAVCAISTPLNLMSSSIQMLRLENRLYTLRFLKTLNQKLRLKKEQYPDVFDISHISKIKTVMDFDDYYTGPLNGFEDAKDYYTKCSSDQFLPSINIPALVINSLDDPFLGAKCFPAKEEIPNPNVKLCYTKYGGHVGFYKKGQSCWEEERIAEFFDGLESH